MELRTFKNRYKRARSYEIYDSAVIEKAVREYLGLPASALSRNCAVAKGDNRSLRGVILNNFSKMLGRDPNDLTFLEIVGKLSNRRDFLDTEEVCLTLSMLAATYSKYQFGDLWKET